jgi:hypothetical protein
MTYDIDHCQFCYASMVMDAIPGSAGGLQFDIYNQ